MIRRRFVPAAAAALAVPGLFSAREGRAQDVFQSAKAAYRLVTRARKLEQPWSMAFLPRPLEGADGLLHLVTHTDDGGLFRLEPA